MVGCMIPLHLRYLGKHELFLENNWRPLRAEVRKEERFWREIRDELSSAARCGINNGAPDRGYPH